MTRDGEAGRVAIGGAATGALQGEEAARELMSRRASAPAVRVLRSGRARARRRLRHAAGLLVLSAAVTLWARRLGDGLGDASVATGWLLATVLLGLAAFNLRKLVPVLRLGPAASWLRWHASGGLFACVVFVLHVEGRVPDGRLEGAVALAFALVTLTGFVGLWMSRTFPKRLARRGEEVLHERIPRFRARLHAEAEDVVREVAGPAALASGNALASFHARRVEPFLAAPANRWAHLRGSGAPLATLTRDMESIRRRLDVEESAALDELLAICRKKDELDFHDALQGALKGWLFVHIPLTVVLLLLLVVHVWAVHAFGAAA